MKLDDAIAVAAHEMLVLRISVIMFEKRPVAHVEPTEQTGIHELGQRSINSRTADSQAGVFQVIDQLLGVEMVVALKDMTHEIALLAGKSLLLRSAGEVFSKLVFRRLTDGNGLQCHGLRPSRNTTKVPLPAIIRPEGMTIHMSGVIQVVIATPSKDVTVGPFGRLPPRAAPACHRFRRRSVGECGK